MCLLDTPCSSSVYLIDPCEDQRWDHFINKHPFGWITHSSAWKKVLETCFAHLKGHYLAILDKSNQSIIAAMPVYKVKSCFTGTRLVSIPFATICDPLVSSTDEADLLIEHVLALANEQKCKYVEIRCLHTGAMIKNEKLTKAEFYINQFIELNTSLETLQKRFHRTCVLQRIRRAEKSGLKLIKGNCEKDLKDFYVIYTETRKRLTRPPLPFRFLEMLWKEFAPRDQIRLLLAQKDGRLLAGIILFVFKKRVSIEFAASLESAWRQSPNHLLFWEAIKIAQAEGFEIIDFGRTSPNNISLMDFKSRWGTETMIMPQYFFPRQLADLQIAGENSFQHKMVQTICKHTSQSMLPMIGNFCYRHLA